MGKRVKSSGRKRWARAAAVSGGLALAPLHSVFAQAAPESSAPNTIATAIEEIIVTASRRAVDVSSIPYNISAVSADQLAQSGVTNVQTLSQQVPNLNVGSNGNRFLVAQVPIIRGLNASSTVGFSALGQTPVAVYLGNVEAGNYFPIDDVQRVEVLRGPQGTLFGGGSLGGTLRLIPNDPKLDAFEGSVTGSGGFVGHSDDKDYSVAGVMNVPLGSTLALRVSAKHQYDAGFIDKKQDVAQQGGPLSPVAPANPSDFANSPPVYFTDKDYNWSKTTSACAALRWKPASEFDATLAFNYAKMTGRGAPIDKAGYAGGAWPLDPAAPVPPLGEYQDFDPGAEPFSRDSYLGSLDMSYDLGFATLSSTTSYLDTDGRSHKSSSIGYVIQPPAVIAYYAGSPVFPRFLPLSVYGNARKNFVQEFRLVSPGNQTLDYTIGVYYQHEKVNDSWDIYAPGNNAWIDATNAPEYAPVRGDEIDRIYSEAGESTFKQQAIYGELTWSPQPKLHLTGGARLFHYTFDRLDHQNLIGFGIVSDENFSSSKTDAIFKGNVSYELGSDDMVYATFSQGFRRGGVNAFPTSGVFPESPDLINYKSDKVDNYEIGVKGRVGAWRYNFDVFNDIWKNVQIDTATPVMLYAVVVNGDKARSRGIEAELSGPIAHDLNLSFGYAYADARLTKDFCRPATGYDSAGQAITVPCGISGRSGDRLPGSPQHSASATLTYELPLSDHDAFKASLNVNYKGTVVSGLGAATVQPKTLPDYFLVNAAISYSWSRTIFTVYGKNIFDKRAVLGYSQRILEGSDLNTTNNITTPRQVGATVSYRF